MATTSLATLFSVSLQQDYTLVLFLSPWLLVTIVVVIGAWYAMQQFVRGRRGGRFEIDRADIGLGAGTISLRPNVRDQQMAYAIWVELSTRKIGLPIDLDHDVIAEIYDSWHTFFSITRELIKDIPVNKVRSNSTRKIVELSMDVLNEGLRPHLTKWQARFRHWYKQQLENANGDIDPQYIQSQYPKYQKLRDDLLEVNKRLMSYRKKMRELVLEK